MNVSLSCVFEMIFPRRNSVQHANFNTLFLYFLSFTLFYLWFIFCSSMLFFLADFRFLLVFRANLITTFIVEKKSISKIRFFSENIKKKEGKTFHKFFSSCLLSLLFRIYLTVSSSSSFGQYFLSKR